MQSSSSDSPTSFSRGPNRSHLESGSNPFQQNQMAGSLPVPSGYSQIPTQRLSPSFPSAENDTAPGATLNMLCDVAAAGNGKRMGSDMQFGERKRVKSRAQPGKVSCDNPVLMQRLNALGGGFPMPRWAQAAASKGDNKQRKEDLRQQQRNRQIDRVNKMSGGFPMPPMTEGKVLNVAPKSLSSFRTLWLQTNPDVQKEVLSRRLGRGDVKILNRFIANTTESV